MKKNRVRLVVSFLFSLSVFLILPITVHADDHGDDFSTATSVSIGNITPGYLDIAGDLDYFRFTVSQSGTYVMYTRNTQGQHPWTTGVLYNGSLGQVPLG